MRVALPASVIYYKNSLGIKYIERLAQHRVNNYSFFPKSFILTTQNQLPFQLPLPPTLPGSIPPWMSVCYVGLSPLSPASWNQEGPDSQLFNDLLTLFPAAFRLCGAVHPCFPPPPPPHLLRILLLCPFSVFKFHLSLFCWKSMALRSRHLFNLLVSQDLYLWVS